MTKFLDGLQILKMTAFQLLQMEDLIKQEEIKLAILKL